MESLCRHCGKQILWVESEVDRPGEWWTWPIYRREFITKCLRSPSGFHNPVRNEGQK